MSWRWQELFCWGYEDDESTERDTSSSVAPVGKRLQDKRRRRSPKGSAVPQLPGGTAAPSLPLDQGRLAGKPRSEGKARLVTAQPHLLSFEQDE